MSYPSVFRYPIVYPFTLGLKWNEVLELSPDLPIQVKQVFCNAPSPGMFIIEASELFYEHDPYSCARELGMPIKQPGLILRKNCNLKLKVIYTGFIPPGFIEGKTFLFSYAFAGLRCL